MNVRKVQETFTNGQIFVYIPKDIVELIGLEKGDILDFNLEQNKITMELIRK